MEEKRLLMAVVLSLAVLLIWQLVFKSPPSPKPPAPGTTETVAPTDPYQAPVTPPTGTPVPETEAPAPVMPYGELVGGNLETESQAEPVDVTVETDLYRCVISTAGGHLESFELKGFRETAGDDSPPKQLISDNLPAGKDPLSMALYLGGKQLPNSSVYTADRQEINLEGKSPATTQTLKLALRTNEGYQVERTYTFTSDDYRVRLGIDVFADNSSTGEAKIKGKVSEQAMLHWYTHVEPDQAKNRFETFAAITYANNAFEKEDPKKLKKKGPFNHEGAAWAGFADSYFLRVIIAEEEPVKVINDIEGPEDDQNISQRLEFPQRILEPGRSVSYKAVAYIGPKEFERLRAIGKGLDRAVEYGRLEVVIRPLIWILNLFQQQVHNWGLSIILLTVLIKVLFYPLTIKSQQQMKKMQVLQPRIKELQEKYKGDREKINTEMMALYRSQKVNPVGGCLPMLLQLPVLYALYRALYVSIELRHAHFVGWITDLSSPESLFTLPLFGGVNIGLMPLLMGGSMYIQQKMTPTTMDPAQAKMFMAMPVIFTFISFGFPSGLVLYWSVSNLLTIAQQYVINRRGS